MKKVILTHVNKDGSTNKTEELTLEELKARNYKKIELDECDGELMYAYVEAETKAKNNKIAGDFEIIEKGGYIIGCMSWETPGLKLKHIETGKIYFWVSDTLNKYKISVDNEKETINLSAFIRVGQCGDHLYKVKVNSQKFCYN